MKRSIILKADRNTVTKPLYRVTFAHVTAQDDEGRDQLAKPKETGAVRPRKGDKKGAILNLDLIPVELAQRQGVIVLLPVADDHDAA